MLNTQPNFHTPGQTPLRAYTPGDDFYAALIDCHRGLSDEHSRLLNARLILLLANHIGDLAVLRHALQAATTFLPLPLAGEGEGGGEGGGWPTPSPQPSPASGRGGPAKTP